MKTFIGACITLIATFTVVWLLSCGVKNTAQKMLTLADGLNWEDESESASAEAALAKLVKTWDDAKPQLNIALSHVEVEAIDRELIELGVRLTCGDTAGYAASGAKLRHLLGEIIASEGLSFSCIF